MNKKWKPKKSKSVAVVISILFGVFGWAYTYKYDAWKFWLNIVLAVITLGFWGVIAWIWVMVDQLTKPKEAFENYFD